MALCGVPFLGSFTKKPTGNTSSGGPQNKNHTMSSLIKTAPLTKFGRSGSPWPHYFTMIKVTLSGGLRKTTPFLTLITPRNSKNNDPSVTPHKVRKIRKEKAITFRNLKQVGQKRKTKRSRGRLWVIENPTLCFHVTPNWWFGLRGTKREYQQKRHLLSTSRGSAPILSRGPSF